MAGLTRLLLIGALVLLSCCVVALATIYPVLFIVIAGALFALFRRPAAASTTCGSARWANSEDLAGLLGGGNGMSVGIHEEEVSRRGAVMALLDRRLSHQAACKRFFAAFSRAPPGETVRLNKAVMCCAVSPSGGGKGTGLVVPHLLECTDNMVVIDFKGENYTLTHRQRREVMGHRVVRLDPFRVCGDDGGDRFNAVDLVGGDEDPLALDQIRSLANALVVRTGHEHDQHFNDAAEIWLSGLLGFVAATLPKGDPNRSLQGLRRLLTDQAKTQQAIEYMCASAHFSGLLARLGGQMKSFEGKELASTRTTSMRYTAFLDSLHVADNTRESSFDVSELIRGKMDIFLILPPEFQKSQAGLLRLWIGSLLKSVTRGGIQENRLTRWILDEAAALGKMEVIEDALQMYRGYGVRMTFILQSLGQLKKMFPEDSGQTFLSNVTLIAFAVNDNETAKLVVERMGKYTQYTSSGGRGRNSGGGSSYGSSGFNQSTSFGASENEGWQESGRELLTTDEVMRLDPRTAITLAPGLPPIWTRLVRYYEKPADTGGKPHWWFARALVFFLVAALFAFALAGGMNGSPKRNASPAAPANVFDPTK